MVDNGQLWVVQFWWGLKVRNTEARLSRIFMFSKLFLMLFEVDGVRQMCSALKVLCGAPSAEPGATAIHFDADFAANPVGVCRILFDI